jgi:hypothetical protein
MKKTILALSAVVLAGLAFSASSAMAWTNSGSYTLSGASSLTSTITSGPLAGSNVGSLPSFDVTLNSGLTNTGTVDAASFSSLTTNVPGNTLTSLVANDLPWSLGGVDNLGNGDGPITIVGVTFTATLSVNGPLTVVGTAVGNYDDATGTIQFTSTSGSNLHVAGHPTWGVSLVGSVTSTTSPFPSLES